MLMRWIALLVAAWIVSACAHAPGSTQASTQPWNGGTWNSVLGYVGPASAMVVGGP